MIDFLLGDCREQLGNIHDESVHCCVTSPPYWGLRDYGVQGQLGLEETPEAYVDKLVEVFRDVKRCLRSDGTLWLNLGDSYVYGRRPQGMKPKDLVGIPWMVAFALRADGWYLRSDIVWQKPNVMPESVRDRPTRSHEFIFLLSKSEEYWYDSEAIKEPSSSPPVLPWKERKAAGEMSRHGGSFNALPLNRKPGKQRGHSRRHDGFNGRWDQMSKEEQCALGRNKRDVWTVATRAFKGAHFATYPPDLIRPCILAGCPPGGTVLDPFGGAGTTGLVAEQEGRNAILIELNAEYMELAKERTMQSSLLVA